LQAEERYVLSGRASNEPTVSSGVGTIAIDLCPSSHLNEMRVCSLLLIFEEGFTVSLHIMRRKLFNCARFSGKSSTPGKDRWPWPSIERYCSDCAAYSL